MLKFFWNGIKDNGGKLQRASFSDGELINFPKGTITIYARDYDGFSKGVNEALTVTNDTDIQTDYFSKDCIRVQPDHPLYAQVKVALAAHTKHCDRLHEAYLARQQVAA